MLFFCRCSLFLVQGEVGTDTHCLISNLFDVSSSSTVEEMNRKSEIRISWGSGIVGHVAATGLPVTIADCYEDKRFNQVKTDSNYHKSILKQYLPKISISKPELILIPNEARIFKNIFFICTGDRHHHGLSHSFNDVPSHQRFTRRRHWRGASNQQGK